MTRPRWTVRRLMLGVAGVAALIGLGQMGTRWDSRRKKARHHGIIESAHAQLAERGEARSGSYRIA